ncbi:MBL fold metallo-hydrolase [Candidatus Micrarchaeota archaeon]|nr:MBL fold metallo-hydrolase [Candidatus Micrarchaeota archaeon]
MKKILALFIITVLLFGCIGGDNKPPIEVPTNNGQNNTTIVKPPVTIITDPQRNQTIVEGNNQNTTTRVEPNQTKTEYTNDPNANILVYFLDIGTNGNAILIRKGDFDVLVDGGPEETAGKVVDFLRTKSVDDIDLMISTNADPRNYAGLEAVADQYPVENFWYGVIGTDQKYIQIVSKINQKAKFMRNVKTGNFDSFDGINFLILSPNGDEYGDFNNNGLVVRVEDRNFTLLLTSGIQTGAQGRLINGQTQNIKTQVMLAPYYGTGSGTSSAGVWLLTAKPQTVIITGSGEENALNGGSRDPFRRIMGQYGIKYYETYKSGNVKITSDGRTYAIETAR